jgi:diadenosine tetraphosphate (Ap4A) HIT family hydrolase
MKLLETETVFAFLDIGPIARGHCLVIPKRARQTSLRLPLSIWRFG